MTEHLKMTEETLASYGTLYKYRDAGSPWSWETLRNQELYLANPREFNDPFDANILMRYDLASEEFKRKVCEKYVAEVHPGAGLFLREKLMTTLLGRMNDPETHDKAMQDWIDSLVSKVRMVCLCPERDNILLWSHYANNHTGFAIGFDAVQLHNLWRTNGGFILGHALYQKEYPILFPPDVCDIDARGRIITIIMNIKSQIWKYEKEIRLTMFNGPQKASFAPNLINDIVLGCNIELNNQSKILEIVDRQYSHASVHRAKLRRGAFALDFDRLR